MGIIGISYFLFLCKGVGIGKGMGGGKGGGRGGKKRNKRVGKMMICGKVLELCFKDVGIRNVAF